MIFWEGKNKAKSLDRCAAGIWSPDKFQKPNPNSKNQIPKTKFQIPNPALLVSPLAPDASRSLSHRKTQIIVFPLNYVKSSSPFRYIVRVHFNLEQGVILNLK
jgi:hypothetical protein